MINGSRTGLESAVATYHRNFEGHIQRALPKLFKAERVKSPLRKRDRAFCRGIPAELNSLPWKPIHTSVCSGFRLARLALDPIVFALDLDPALPSAKSLTET